MTPRDLISENYKRAFQDPQVVRRYDEEISGGTQGRFRSIRKMVNSLVVRAENRALSGAFQYFRPVKRIVNIPCGSGKELPILRLRGRIIGIDSSLPMLRIYARKGGIEMVCADIAATPLKDASADIVLCNRFLHRQPAATRHDVLVELRRISRRWAIVYFGVSGSIQAVITAIERVLGLGDRGLQFLCSPANAREEIAKSGWHVLGERAVMRGASTGHVFILEKGSDP